MKIFNRLSDQVAYRVKDQETGMERYDCYLANRPSNEKIHAHSFEHVRDAAIFMLSNVGAGIRMNPGSAIISDNVAIELD